LGETHGDRVAHHLEHRVLKSLATTNRCALSMEMFETDKQLILDEYLLGHIPESSMHRDCKVWVYTIDYCSHEFPLDVFSQHNYQDYRPMVEFARKEGNFGSVIAHRCL